MKRYIDLDGIKWFTKASSLLFGHNPGLTSTHNRLIEASCTQIMPSFQLTTTVYQIQKARINMLLEARKGACKDLPLNAIPNSALGLSLLEAGLKKMVNNCPCINKSHSINKTKKQKKYLATANLASPKFPSLNPCSMSIFRHQHTSMILESYRSRRSACCSFPIDRVIAHFKVSPRRQSISA
jgi:hypothetical protein